MATIAEARNNRRREESQAKAEENFSKPDLMMLIHDRITQRHLLDTHEKMACFLICCTAYLQPSSRRQSLALKGARSSGKDNLIRSVLELFPEEDWLFLTNATQAALEDDVTTRLIIAHSEVNLQRDDRGAGSHLVEVLKQLSEGGTTAIKKDLRKGFKEVRYSVQEQKSILYGTAEVGVDDDELQTRFVVGAVSAPPFKVEKVNRSTINQFVGIIQDEDFTSDWVSWGIRDYLKINPRVKIPFLDKLPEGFFDNQDARSMRDTKRFLSCVSACTWCHKRQREQDSEGFILATPYDFLLTQMIMQDFFNHTYSGVGDQRLQATIDAINDICDSSGGDVFKRHDLQEKMGVSLNTLKGYLKGVCELSVVRFHSREVNEIFLRRCQKGVKRVFMGVKWRDLFSDWVSVKGVKIPQSAVNELEKWDKLLKTTKNSLNHSVSRKIDTLKLTPDTNSDTLEIEEEEVLDEIPAPKKPPWK